MFYTPRTIASITQAEAEAVLQQAIQYAQTQNLDGLCSLTEVGAKSMFCRGELDLQGGWVAVPRDPPRIVSTHRATGAPNDNVDGFVLVLEGVDGLGQPYQTDFVVRPLTWPGPLGNGLGVEMPFYWSGLKNTRSSSNIIHCDAATNTCTTTDTIRITAPTATP